MSDSEQVAIGGLRSVNHRDLDNRFEDGTIDCPGNRVLKWEKNLTFKCGELIAHVKEKLRHTWQCFQQPQLWNSVTLLPHGSYLDHQHPGRTPEKHINASI